MHHGLHTPPTFWTLETPGDLFLRILPTCLGTYLLTGFLIAVIAIKIKATLNDGLRRSTVSDTFFFTLFLWPMFLVFCAIIAIANAFDPLFDWLARPMCLPRKPRPIAYIRNALRNKTPA